MNDQPRGEVLLITGPMFAGKSAALIVEARRHVTRFPGSGMLVMKPAFDTRDGPALIVSRDHSRIDARAITAWPAGEVARHAVLVIDEVQFLVAPHYAGDIVGDIARAAARGTRIVAGGLDTDYLRRPFDVVMHLAAIADRHRALQARCHVCGAPAPWTAKRVETGQRLELGDATLYEARCDRHWTPPDAHPAAACR